MLRNYLGMIVLLLMVGSTMFGPSLLRKWKQRRSRSWPMTTARFVSGDIEVGYGPDGGGAVYTLRANYTYSVGTFRFAGEYVENVVTMEEDTHILRSLEAGPLFVRYHPSRPDESTMDPYRDVLPDRATRPSN